MCPQVRLLGHGHRDGAYEAAGLQQVQTVSGAAILARNNTHSDRRDASGAASAGSRPDRPLETASAPRAEAWHGWWSLLLPEWPGSSYQQRLTSTRTGSTDSGGPSGRAVSRWAGLALCTASCGWSDGLLSESCCNRCGRLGVVRVQAPSNHLQPPSLCQGEKQLEGLQLSAPPLCYMTNGTSCIQVSRYRDMAPFFCSLLLLEES